MPSFSHSRGIQAQLAWTKALLPFILTCFYLVSLISCGEPFSRQIANQAIQQTIRGTLTYVAIGASDTFGIGTDDPYTQNWPSDLAAKLGPKVHLIDLGIPGILLHDALSQELPIALDAHPNLITIWLAVDDLVASVPLESYAHDLDLLLHRLRTGIPHARIAIANIPDLSLLPRFSTLSQQGLQELQTQILDYNAIIETNVQRYHAILVNLYQQGYDLKNHPEYISHDGFHPNDIGYLRLAALFYQALQATH